MSRQTRLKVTVVVGLLVSLCAAGQFFFSSRSFDSVTTGLADELNDSTVRLFSSQLNAMVEKYSSQVKQLTDFAGLKDESVVAFSVYRAGSGAATWELSRSYKNEAVFAENGLDSEEIERVRKAIPVPFARVMSQGTVLFNSTRAGGLPLLSLSVNVTGADGVPSVGVLDLKPDSFLIQLRDRHFSTVWVANGVGETLIHSDQKQMERPGSILEKSLLKEDGSPGEILHRRWSDDGKVRRVSAWVSPKSDFRVISEVDESRIAGVKRQLAGRSAVWALALICLAFVSGHLLARKIDARSKEDRKKNEEVARTLISRAEETEKNERTEVEILREIVSGWKRSFETEGWTGLERDLKKPVTGYGSLLEEDLFNLELIVQSQTRRLERKS